MKKADQIFRVLLVEDDHLQSIYQKKQLEEKGYDTKAVLNGEDAVETVLNSDLSFDIILMDIDLGSGMDGAEVSEELLKHIDIPILFLSALTKPEVIKKIEKISSYGYVVKGSGIEVLNAAMKMAIRLFNSKMQLKQELDEHKKTEERLRLSEKALFESEALYRSLYKDTPVMQHSIDHNGRIISVSNKWLQVMGYSEDDVIGCKSIDFLTEVSRKFAIDIKLPELYEKGYCVDVPFQFVKKTGEIIDIQLSAISNTDDSSNSIRFLAVLIDVTEKKKAEKKIEFQANLLEAVEQAVIVTKPDGEVIFWNPYAEKLYGWTAEQAIGRLVYELTIPRVSQKHAADIMDKLNSGQSWSGEFEVHSSDGAIFWASVSDTPISDDNGELTAIIGISKDISEIKGIENELRKSQKRLRALSHHLQNAQEEQNAYIAREIHDDLGQEMTAMEMILTLFEDELDRQQINNVKISDFRKELRTQLNTVVDKSRKLTLELTPTVLETYDLIGAINWLTDEFTKHSGIKVRRNILTSRIDLGKAKNLSVFRIVQEAFNNITKHSKAEHVLIEVFMEKKNLCINISDDGVGFGENEAQKKNRFGLINMQERAAYCGGEFEIAGNSGKGTLLKVRIPLETQK